MDKKLLCTLGPSSLNKKVICRLSELGTSAFRINLSHTGLEDLEKYILLIREHSDVPICLDTEGAQIRSVIFGEKRLFRENEVLRLGPAGGAISLYPQFALAMLEDGDLLSVDFDTVLMQVISVKDGSVTARVVSSGWVGNNKAVNLLRGVDLPPFTEKDREAVRLGLKLGVSCFALSFANSSRDVLEFSKLTGPSAAIISKIESRKGCENMDAILAKSAAILIDRGDLSREIPIDLIPFYQKKIVGRANAAGKEVYIATNLLESMTEKPYPTRAEVNDVMNALEMGADGLVLAAETAIGKWPIESATMIARLIKQFLISRSKEPAGYYTDAISMLVEPHGGCLIRRFEDNPDWDAVRRMPVLKAPDSVIMDAEQIGIGTYSPLEGFMARDEVDSVLDHYRLPGGPVWTLPIVLQKSKSELSGIEIGREAALVNEADGDIYAVLKIRDIYPFPFDEVCRKWFGTLDDSHPGVFRLRRGGDCFVGAEVRLLKRRSTRLRPYEFTPQQLRHIFETKGWSRVVGFHTRNAAHRGHEAIQRIALEMTDCDGLLISPVTGGKKKGDFTSEVIINSYQMMLDNGAFGEGRVFIAAFPTHSRYSGAREAVFTALCRKNYGCSHFIVGRDHTGVGNFYEPLSAKKLFESLGDIGIKPVFFDAVQFCPFCNDYVFDCPHPGEKRFGISGTAVRSYITRRAKPPEWLMRKEVSDFIIGRMNDGMEVFVP